MTHKTTDKDRSYHLGKGLFIATTFILISITIFLAFDYSRNNIKGTWSSQFISQKIKRTVNKSLAKWTQDKDNKDYITDISATLDLSNGKGHAAVTAIINRKKLA